MAVSGLKKKSLDKSGAITGKYEGRLKGLMDGLILFIVSNSVESVRWDRMFD